MTQDELAALDRAARESTEEQQLLWMRPATHRISTELLALYRAGRIAVIDDGAVERVARLREALRDIAEMTDVEADFDGFAARTKARKALETDNG